MQNAFEEMATSSHKYFPTDEIRRRESITIPRLANTAEFYRDRLQSGNKERVIVPEKSISEWIVKREQEMLRNVQQVVAGVDSENPWKRSEERRVGKESV